MKPDFTSRTPSSCSRTASTHQKHPAPNVAISVPGRGVEASAVIGCSSEPAGETSRPDRGVEGARFPAPPSAQEARARRDGRRRVAEAARRMEKPSGWMPDRDGWYEESPPGGRGSSPAGGGGPTVSLDGRS